MEKKAVERVLKLREKMKEYGIDAYIILSDDFHASEYVCDYFSRNGVIAAFAVGACIGGIFFAAYGIHVIWCSCILLCISFLLMHLEKLK